MICATYIYLVTKRKITKKKRNVFAVMDSSLFEIRSWIEFLLDIAAIELMMAGWLLLLEVDIS